MRVCARAGRYVPYSMGRSVFEAATAATPPGAAALWVEADGARHDDPLTPQERDGMRHWLDQIPHA